MQPDDRLVALSDRVYDLLCSANDLLLSPSLDHVNLAPVSALLELLHAVVSSQSVEQLRDEHNLDAPDLRRALWRAIALTDPDVLARVHLGVLPSRERICLGELTALAAFRLALLLHASAGDDRTASTLWTQDVDVAAQTPVSVYSTLTMVRALQVLRQEMTRCTLSSELVQYCEALEARAAALLFFAWPAAVHDSVELCTLATRVNEQAVLFRANETLLEIVWCSFSGVYRRVLQGASFMPLGEVWPVSDAEALALVRLRDWFSKKAGEMMADESSLVLKHVYPRLQLRPGDIELQRLRRRGIMPDISGILQEVCEPGRMADIMRESELPISLVLQRVLPSVEPGAPEAPLASLSMYDLLDVSTRECGAAAFGMAFAAPETTVLADPDSVQRLSHHQPMMVQVFNHWQFVRNGRLYMLNSFLRSLYTWLHSVLEMHEARQDAGGIVGDVVDLVQQQTGAYYELQALIMDEALPPQQQQQQQQNNVIEFV
jgi:hypothetical protein